jgi:metallo-beta-lactamase class B
MRRKILKLLVTQLRLVRVLLVVKSSIAGILLLSISSIYATEPTVSIYPVSDSLFVAEDSHYAKTNYAVYLAAALLTVVGAGWSPETAELLAQEIKKLTNKPIGDVIVPDHDPEYAGGCAYWKRTFPSRRFCTPARF